MHSKRTLSPSFSVYLDLVRFTAALVVFFEHAKLAKLIPGPEWTSGLATAAVAAFFVLSGYVISATTDVADGWRTFAVLRAARLYSVVIPAWLLSCALKGGYAVYAGSEALSVFLHEDLAWWRIVAAATFTGECWTLHVPIPWDGPVWSLDFEAAYYLLFALLLFSKGRARAISIGLIALIAGPKILLLLPCWLLGVALADRPDLAFSSQPCARVVAGVAPLALVLVAYSGIETTIKNDILWPNVPGFWRLQDAQNFATFYLDAILIAAAFIAVRQLTLKPVDILARMAPVVRWTAGYTFSLYLFHRPFQNLAEALLNGRDVSFWESSSILAAILVLVVALGSITEKRKDVWRRWFTYCLRPSLRRPLANQSA